MAYIFVFVKVISSATLYWMPTGCFSCFSLPFDSISLLLRSQIAVAQFVLLCGSDGSYLQKKVGDIVKVKVEPLVMPWTPF